MNVCGVNVKLLLSCLRISAKEMVVFHDDLDLKAYTYKLATPGMSFKGHNGLKSIGASVGKDFYKMKLGIGRPESREPEDVA